MTFARAGAVSLSGAGLVLVAFVFDAATLFVAAVAFIGLGLVSPAWVWLTARAARAELFIDVDRVVEDQPLEIRVAVRRGRLGLPGAEVIEPFGGSVLPVDNALATLGSERVVVATFRARFHRRGLHTVGPPVIAVTDPLELSSARVTGSAPRRRLLVLPRTEPVRWSRTSRGTRMRIFDGASSPEAMAAADLDGLRPYRPGTPASRIHWPAAARGAGLIERRLLADGEARPLVVLDARGGGPADLLDAAVRAAASLALDLARHGGCGLLLPGEQRPTSLDRSLTAWPAAHARLATVRGVAGHAAPSFGASTGRPVAVVYVTPSPGDAVARMLATARGAAVLVVPEQALVDGRPPSPRGTARPLFTVAGCHGFLMSSRPDRRWAPDPPAVAASP
jgi:uncharacterized protein (DUF58 family)